MGLYATLKAKRLPRYEHLYLVFDSWNMPWKAKIGISQDGAIRKVDIESDIRRKTGQSVKLRCYRAPVLYALWNERLAHRILSKHPIPEALRGTDGATEWRWYVNVISFAILWATLAWFGVDAAKWKAALILCLPIPFDFFLIVYGLMLIQWALVALGFYALYWAFPVLVKIISMFL